MPYAQGERETPCDPLLRPGIDYVYVPFGRTFGNLQVLNNFVADATLITDLLPDHCREVARNIICAYYYPTCGNNTTFEPPKAVCQEECMYLRDILCPEEWQLALDHLNSQDFIETYGLELINCSTPGEFISPLPHCCTDAGVNICK